ncbi:hypothetical protein KKP90_01610 [Methanothermococcus sp. SCGC AD-155-E23]|nr:hypothetical protein [Methanothermococcus sp. SCGC AD-155-E23]
MCRKKLLLLIFFIVSFTQIHGNVMKISNFTVVIDVDRDPQHIFYNITLQNLVDYPLVPGIVELRLQKQEPKKLWIIPLPFEKEVKPIKVENLKGYYSFDRVNWIPMKTYVEYHNNYSVIKYEIWEPIEKKSNITVSLEYDAHILEDGILFKTLSIPFGSNMDIEHLKVRFVTNKYSQTYQYPPGDTFKVPKDSLLMINAEFSILPLPKLPTYGYLLFWLSVFALVFLVLVYEVIRSYGRENRESQ